MNSWALIQEELKKEISLEDYEHIIVPLKAIQDTPDKLVVTK